jgi:NitT/TauT family transport system substrate-binding protein
MVAVLSAAALALAACGGSTSSGSEADGSGSTLRVGVNHWAATTEIKLGEQKDFFSDEGLKDVKLQTFGPSPTVIAALQSNKIDIGVIPTVDYLGALAQHLKLTAIAPIQGFPADPAEWQKYDAFDLFVRPDANVKRPRDLEGKTVAASVRKGLFEESISYIIKEDGGDPSKVHWIQMVGAPSLEAFKAGRIDAAPLAPPFSADAEKAGGKVLTRVMAPLHDGAPWLLWVASPKVAENSKKMAAIQRAVVRANEAANADPDGTLAAAAKEAGIPVEVMKARPMNLYFPTTYDQAGIESLAQKLVDMKFLESVPDVSGSFAALPDVK